MLELERRNVRVVTGGRSRNAAESDDEDQGAAAGSATIGAGAAPKQSTSTSMGTTSTRLGLNNVTKTSEFGLSSMGGDLSTTQLLSQLTGSGGSSRNESLGLGFFNELASLSSNSNNVSRHNSMAFNNVSRHNSMAFNRNNSIGLDNFDLSAFLDPTRSNSLSFMDNGALNNGPDFVSPDQADFNGNGVGMGQSTDPHDMSMAAREEQYRNLAQGKDTSSPASGGPSRKEGSASSVVSDGSNEDANDKDPFLLSQQDRSNSMSFNMNNFIPDRSSSHTSTHSNITTAAAATANSLLGNLKISGVSASQHYEMLKLHHMNLLNEIHETTLMMDMHQQHQMKLQKEQQEQLLKEHKRQQQEQHQRALDLAALACRKDSMTSNTPVVDDSEDGGNGAALVSPKPESDGATSSSATCDINSLSKEARREQLRKIQAEIAERQRILMELGVMKEESNKVEEKRSSSFESESERATKRIKTF